LFNKLATLLFVCAVLGLPSALVAQTAAPGIVTGTVFDAQTSNPIIGAKIYVNGQTTDRQVTDTSGAFRIELSGGKYTLKFTADNYQDVELTDLEVVSGQAVDASTVMANKNSVTTVDVVEKISAVTATAEAMLTERKLASVVSDSLSNQELKQGTASDAAKALEKVTGVSVVDNGYVYVRGLGERYSATMLNSAMIPTTEPEKRVVPLDLFPAALIDSIKILKTYSPDLPGEFSGGLVQMQTVEFPAQKLLQFSTSIGFNTRTTFGRFASYAGGSLDTFGFDDGTRGLPGVIPANSRIVPGRNSEAEIQEFGRSFSRNWEPALRDSVRPSQSYNLVGGGTFGKWGLVGALTFSNKPQFQSEVQNYYTVQGPGLPLGRLNSYDDFRVYNQGIKLGGIFNAAYKINEANKILFRNTLTRDTDKEARQFSGFFEQQGGIVSSERLRWIERGLISTSVEGDHAAAKLKNLLLKWQFTYSSATRDEPDLREVFRGRQANGSFQFLAIGSSGFRFYNSLRDRIYEPQVELSQPFFKGNISGLWKIGFRGTVRDRDFSGRRFRFLLVNPTGIDLRAPSNQLFSRENIRPNGLALREETRATDTYDASMRIYGGFAMVDLGIGTKIRLVGGIRFEDADIAVNTIDPLVPGARPFISGLKNRDPLPGVNLIYQITPRQNFRVGYSRTVSRPDFRELSPFDFTNVQGGFAVSGNPDLVRASVQNVDARWEWFLGGNQILAASFFYKTFDKPIENAIQFTGEFRQTFVNADQARNSGFELEMRKSLGFMNKKLSDFAIQSNFTFVDSNVDIPARTGQFDLTSLSRPLMGQSRFIYNLMGEWSRPQLRSSAKFYWNSVSRRITDVGSNQLPDIYQERNTFVDFVYQVALTESGKANLKFNAENLLDNTYKWTQGGLLFRQFQLGRTFSVGFSYAIF
jgi:outer membrane receptor protein involved in Fe transport